MGFGWHRTAVISAKPWYDIEDDWRRRVRSCLVGFSTPVRSIMSRNAVELDHYSPTNSFWLALNDGMAVVQT